jgi:hypothetical protein
MAHNLGLHSRGVQTQDHERSEAGKAEPIRFAGVG